MFQAAGILLFCAPSPLALGPAACHAPGRQASGEDHGARMWEHLDGLSGARAAPVRGRERCRGIPEDDDRTLRPGGEKRVEDRGRVPGRAAVGAVQGALCKV